MQYLLLGNAVFKTGQVIGGSEVAEPEPMSPLRFEVPDDEAAKERVALIGRGLNGFQPTLLVRVEAVVEL